MPDTLTHVLIGISLALLITPKSKIKGIFIVIGSVLVDIERPFSWMLKFLEVDWINMTGAFHSLFGIFCLSFASASCFRTENIDFYMRFKLIIIGCISHLLMDMTLHPWEEYGIMLFYPIRTVFSFNLVWSGYIWFPLIGFLFLSIVMLFRYFEVRFSNYLSIISHYIFTKYFKTII